ncbi:hypothetical protein D3C72_1502540 [compost metagenome]
MLEIVGEGLIGRCQRDGRWQACGQLFGKRRPGDHRERNVITQNFAGDILQETSGFRFQPFRRPHNARIRAHQRLDLVQHLAKDMARHNHENIAAGGKRGGKIAFEMQRIRERHVRKKRHVAAVVLQRRDMFGIVAPENHFVTISCQSDGKSGAVRAGTDHSH